jgi:hypothetical protein
LYSFALEKVRKGEIPAAGKARGDFSVPESIPGANVSGVEQHAREGWCSWTGIRLNRRCLMRSSDEGVDTARWWRKLWRGCKNDLSC